MDNIKTGHERISGIDIVKILAMFLVTALHITGIGGAVSAAVNPAAKFLLSALEGISFCCINLFALSTGFLCFGRKTRLSRLLQLWIQVVFWALAANIGPALYLKDMSVLTETPFVRLFVISFGTYWYFTAYFALFFFIPLLNSAVEKLSEKHFIAFSLCTAVIFGVLPFLFNNDLFVLNKGYSFVWLSYLYIIGAGFRKFNLVQRLKTPFSAIICIVCAAVQSCVAYISQLRKITFLGISYSDMYNKYNFIFTLILSVSLFALISKIKIQKPKMQNFIKIVASASFSVYLIQCNHSVMREFIEKHFMFIGSYSPVAAAAAAIGISAAVYIGLTVLGILQDALFRLCRIDKLCVLFERLLKRIFSGLYSKVLCKCVEN